jgi:hypothetical protein
MLKECAATMIALPAALGCGQADPAGTWVTYTTFMAYGSADPEARSACEIPLFLGGADADIVVGRDESYFVELQGCRIRTTLEAGVLRARDAPCEPLGMGLEFLRPRVYEELELDTALGTLKATSSSLGPNGEGRCNQLDGQVRKAGTTGAIAWASTIWSFIAETYGFSEGPPRHTLQGDVGGYLVDQTDGTAFVFGLSCTLPGRTAPGEIGLLDMDACPSRFAGAHSVPQFRPISYTLTDTEFTLHGEFGEGNGLFTYDLTSTSLDQDPR